MIGFDQKKVKRSKARGQTIVIAGDFHIPYHDPNCTLLFLAFIAWMKPSIIVLNGDILDFYEASRYPKDPNRKGGLQDELDEGEEFLRRVRAACPHARIIYIGGNHEIRIKSYLWQHPELASLRALKFEELLNFKKYKIEFIEYPKSFILNDFYIHHGQKVNQQSAYTAKNILHQKMMSGITNHVHRLGSHFLKSPGGYFQFHENGCMCLLAPEYVTEPNWQHGFSVLRFINGSAHLGLIPIHGDRMTYAGQDFTITEKK